MEGPWFIYHIRVPRTIKYLGYDTYHEFVCAAQSEESARLTHPDGCGSVSRERRMSDSWVKFEDLYSLEVIQIGISSKEYKEPTVIVASYIAG